MKQPTNSVLFWVREGSDLEPLFRQCCAAKENEQPYGNGQMFTGLSKSWTDGTPESAQRLAALFSEQCKSVIYGIRSAEDGQRPIWSFSTPTALLSVTAGNGRGLICMIDRWKSLETLQQCLNAIDDKVSSASVCKRGDSKDLCIDAVVDFFRSQSKKKKKTPPRRAAAPV